MPNWVPNTFYKIVVEKIPIYVRWNKKDEKLYLELKTFLLNYVTYMNAEKYWEAI